MLKFIALAPFALLLALAWGCASEEQSAGATSYAIVSGHMVVEATLTAHFIGAALAAGMTTE